MGMETMVHFQIGKDAMCARTVAETSAKPSEKLQLHADMNNMHLIEPESGRVV